MFSAIRSMVELASVSEDKGIITISGLPAVFIERDIKNFWTTSKIAGSMFTYLSRNKVRFCSFFAIEFEYILRTMDEQGGTGVSRKTINHIISGLHENTWMKRLKQNENYPKWLKREHLKEIVYDLMPHQVEFLNRYEKIKYQYGLRGLLLSAAAGGGKTLTGIAISLCTESEVTIIVSPKNAIYKVWEKTLNEEMRTPQNPYVADRDGTNFKESKYYIFHFEALDKAMELAKTIKGKKVCVILDESHNFNDAKSLRTDRFLQMCAVCQAENIIWSSGTPIKALGYEAIPLIKSIDPLFTNKAEQGFRKMYGRDARRTLDILKHRVGIISYVVPKKEFMEDKPIERTIEVEMPGSDKYTLESLAVVMKKFIDERMKFYEGKRKEYKKYYDSVIEIHKKSLRTPEQTQAFRRYQNIVDQFYVKGFDPRADAELAVEANKYEKVIHETIPQAERNKFKDAKSVVKYPILKVRGECLGRILSKERMQCHIDMLDYIDFNELFEQIEKKTILFTSYVNVVDAAEKILATKYKRKPLKVYGSTNSELPAIVSKFTSDPDADPLVATYQSLSVAVPLTMANGVILLNAPWRSYEREQAIARAYRIGQDTTVKVFDTILKTGEKVNISSRSIDIMKWSQEQVDSIMGTEGTPAISNESDINGIKYSIESICEDINFEGEEQWDDFVPTLTNRMQGW